MEDAKPRKSCKPNMERGQRQFRTDAKMQTQTRFDRHKSKVAATHAPPMHSKTLRAPWSPSPPARSSCNTLHPVRSAKPSKLKKHSGLPFVPLVVTVASSVASFSPRAPPVLFDDTLQPYIATAIAWSTATSHNRRNAFSSSGSDPQSAARCSSKGTRSPGSNRKSRTRARLWCHASRPRRAPRATLACVDRRIRQ